MSEASDYLPNIGLTALRRRTVVGLVRTWREVTGSARIAITGEVRPSLPREDVEHLRSRMRSCLDPKGGEISARAHTAELGQTYLGLTASGKAKFLRLLAQDFDMNHAALEKVIGQFQDALTTTEKFKLEAKLRETLITPRSRILRQFTALPDGFKFLVDLRADLQPLLAKEPGLRGLEYDLKQILSSWFDVALLDFVELNWHSPAAILEKLMVYEAVHQIRSWDDLKNRLDSDRRVYAFFHSKMPSEPLIFVQVAFVNGMANNVQTLLDTNQPVIDMTQADTAIFYSISNAQKGLAGISFGNFLIKQVVSKLSEQFPQIKTFATLSPVPGFRAWLDPQLETGRDELFTPAQVALLRPFMQPKSGPAKSLGALLAKDWSAEPKQLEGLKPVLLGLCVRYLLQEKKNDRPLDPVASFHLFNGARLERINWMADTSPRGMAQSCGIMVNYHYKLDEIDDNHEAFVRDGKVVASKQVKGYS